MVLSRLTRECLAPGGRVAAAWPGFEEREGQRALATAIAGSIERGGVLLAEAPTGLGKSLAYLLPGLLEAAHHGRRVVVATCTRALQDQLYERDVPAIAKALGVSVAAVRLKGKQNYVCPRGVDLASARGEEEEETLEALRGWMLADEEGDLDRFPAPDADAFRRVRPGVATDPEACTLLSCRRGRECPWVRARRLATEAQVLIVNHALLARAAESEGLIPEHDVLIVDEAHRLEDVLLSQLERSVSRNRFEELLRLLGAGRRRSDAGLLGRLRGYLRPRLDAARPADLGDEIEALAHRAPETRVAVERLFSAIEPRERTPSLYGGRERYRSAGELLGPDLDRLEVVLEHCGYFARALHRFADALITPTASTAALELSAELEQVSARWAVLGAELLDLCEAGRKDCVYWRAWGTGGVRLHGVPVSAGDMARRLLGRARATILTSATLTTAGDFGFTAERLGLGETLGLPYESTIQPSPFDLARQMRAYVFDGGRAAESDAVADVVAELAERTGRSQLVLFTAHDRLRRARERLLASLGDPSRLNAQEWDGSVSQLTERFRARRGSILLGVQSLWEGVDFPGEELEIVVVAKLPFSVPDDPRVEARGERLRERGVEPFRADAVPEAVLRFRQGVGRLIRRADDRGVLVVCDPRLATASYRGPFLDALPAVPLRFSQPRELADDAAAFFASNPAEELA